MYWKVANGLEMFRVRSVLPDVLFVGQLSAIQQVLLLTKLGAFGTQGSVYLGCAYGQCCPAAKPASPTIRSDGQKCQRTCEVDPSWSILLSSALILIHTIHLISLEQVTRKHRLCRTHLLLHLYRRNHLWILALCRYRQEPLHWLLFYAPATSNYIQLRERIRLSPKCPAKAAAAAKWRGRSLLIWEFEKTLPGRPDYLEQDFPTNNLMQFWAESNVNLEQGSSRSTIAWHCVTGCSSPSCLPLGHNGITSAADLPDPKTLIC